MIRHVLERIVSDRNIEKRDLNEILVWVTCSRENLTLGEIDAILKLRPPRGEYVLTSPFMATLVLMHNSHCVNLCCDIHKSFNMLVNIENFLSGYRENPADCVAT